MQIILAKVADCENQRKRQQVSQDVPRQSATFAIRCHTRSPPFPPLPARLRSPPFLPSSARLRNRPLSPFPARLRSTPTHNLAAALVMSLMTMELGRER